MAKTETTETATAGADEALVRAHAAEIKALGPRFGVHNLKFASTGRLLGRIDDDRDALDAAGFALAVEDLLGAEVSLLSEGVLGNPGVSEDLLTATPI